MAYLQTVSEYQLSLGDAIDMLPEDIGQLDRISQLSLLMRNDIMDCTCHRGEPQIEAAIQVLFTAVRTINRITKDRIYRSVSDELFSYIGELQVHRGDDEERDSRKERDPADWWKNA